MLALALGVAACAAPAPPAPVTVSPGPSAATPAVPVQAANSYDGTYAAAPDSGVAPRCRKRITAPLRVGNGVASIQVAGAGSVSGSVMPNGPVEARSGRNTLSGTFTGTTFTGALVAGPCRHELQYGRG